MLLLLKLEWGVGAGQAERRIKDPLAGEHEGWWLLWSKGTDNNRIVRAPGKKAAEGSLGFQNYVEAFGFYPNSNTNL